MKIYVSIESTIVLNGKRVDFDFCNGYECPIRDIVWGTAVSILK